MYIAVKILAHVFPLIPPICVKVSAIITANLVKEAAACVLSFHFLTDAFWEPVTFSVLRIALQYTCLRTYFFGHTAQHVGS